MGGNNEFFENFERNKYLNKLPSMQRVIEEKKINRHLDDRWQKTKQITKQKQEFDS